MAVSPALGPSESRRSKVGSFGEPCPWQLIEVSKEAAAAALSNKNSPHVPTLATPPSRPSNSPAPKYLDYEEPLPVAALDWGGGGGGGGKAGGRGKGRPSWWEQSGFGHEPEEVIIPRRKDLAGTSQDEEGDDVDGGFDPKCFVGEWIDNIGHTVFVSPSGPRGGYQGRRRGRGRRDRVQEKPSKPSMGFLAMLQKPGLPEKCFTIANDRGGNEWTCGNGTLVSEDSGPERLVWRAKDGRKSEWTRRPPTCEVYFDPPPASSHPEAGPDETEWYANGVYMHHEGGDVQPQCYWIMAADDGQHYAEGMVVISEECMGQSGFQQLVDQSTDESGLGSEQQAHQDSAVSKQQRSPQQEQQEQQRDICESVGKVVVGDSAVAAAAANEATFGFGASSWNPSAPAFVPSQAHMPAAVPPAKTLSRPGSAVGTPVLRPASTTPSPLLKPVHPWTSPRLTASGAPVLSAPSRRSSWGRTPTPSPNLGPVPSPKFGPLGAALPAPAVPIAPKSPITITLARANPEIVVKGNRLEWTLPEPWGSLSTFPRDIGLMTPMFGVRLATRMQITFYPNGSRTSEPGHCTVALTRGPDCAGIKFEFLVNGRGIGPKVTLGKRYIGDYPLPFDESEEHKEKIVVVSMQVLDILSTD